MEYDINDCHNKLYTHHRNIELLVEKWILPINGENTEWAVATFRELYKKEQQRYKKVCKDCFNPEK